jgi:hypothetical protein
MNCAEIHSRLTGLPGGAGVADLSAAEREHLDSCGSCRALADGEFSLRARINDAARVAPPDDAYWATILPRVRVRASRRSVSDRAGEWLASGRFVIQGAAVALVVLFFLSVDPADPSRTDPNLTIAALSDSELRDLGLSEKYTGLLDHQTESFSGRTSTLTDFLAELFADNDDAVLYASVDPVALLGEVDEQHFGEIVDILSSQK